MMTPKENLNLPNFRASAMDRRKRCPGSARAEAGLIDEDSAISSEGTLLHAYFCDSALMRDVLKTDQRDLLRIADKTSDFVFDRVREQFTIPEDEPFEEGFEKELWVLRDGKPEISGHSDKWRRYTRLNLVVLLELKFGYLPVEVAATNLQTRTYAVGAVNEWPDSENVVVAIIQPRLEYEKRATIASYERADIDASREELFSIVDACRDPAAPLRATDIGCRYCLARAVCPEFARSMQSGLALIPPIGTADTVAKREADIARSLADMSDTNLGKVLNGIQFAGFIADLTRDEARNRLAADPELANDIGWKLGKEIEKRNIVDPARAVALLVLQGTLSREEILDCSKPSLTKIEEKIREKNKLTYKAAKGVVNETLESVIELQSEKAKLLRA